MSNDSDHHLPRASYIPIPVSRINMLSHLILIMSSEGGANVTTHFSRIRKQRCREQVTCMDQVEEQELELRSSDSIVTFFNTHHTTHCPSLSENRQR